MNILPYTKDHDEFRDRLCAYLAREVVPYADQWEKDRIVPREAWREMGRQGFLCTSVSKEYGGLGGDFLYSFIVTEEMIRSGNYGLMAPLHSDIIVPYIDSYGSESLKRKFLPGCVRGNTVTAIAMTEPGAGSDLAGMQTTAVETKGDVTIDGSKTFISNGINADLIIVAARDPEEENPYQAISLYLLEADTPGFKRGRHLDKMGLNSQDTAELFFSGCRIPVENRLGEKGNGFLMLMEKLQQERLITAIMAMAAAERILEETIDFCKKPPASGRPPAKSQATQFALVEMATDVKLGRTFVEKLTAEHARGENVIIETSMAKYWTTEMVKRTADRCLDFFGDLGMTAACPIERAFRDVRVMSIFAGTNEIMKGIAAKFMGL